MINPTPIAFEKNMFNNPVENNLKISIKNISFQQNM